MMTDEPLEMAVKILAVAVPRTYVSLQLIHEIFCVLIFADTGTMGKFSDYISRIQCILYLYLPMDIIILPDRY